MYAEITIEVDVPDLCDQLLRSLTLAQIQQVADIFNDYLRD